MKIKTLATAVAVTVLATACQKAPEDQAAEEPQKAGGATLETREQKLSYVFGQNVGSQLKAQDVPIDTEVFAQGVDDALSGADSKMSDEEIMSLLQSYQKEQMAEREAMMEEAAKKNKAEGEKFLAENADKEGVNVLDSGLQYKVLEAGEGPSPGPEDQVRVHYRGTLLDGSQFDSSYERGEPATFGVNQVIPGWTEALQLMKEGAKWKLFVPPSLAYGSGGTGGMIGPEQTLIFEVELLKVNPEDAEAVAADSGADGEASGSGDSEAGSIRAKSPRQGAFCFFKARLTASTAGATTGRSTHPSAPSPIRPRHRSAGWSRKRSPSPRHGR